MPIIRKKLYAAEVYPTGIRYNDDTGQVQTLINGTWTDSPTADPRTQTIFPPRTTASPKCDGAESVQVAFKAQIDGVLTAIDGSQTAFTIAGIILSLFTFGVFGIFISLALFLAHAMLDAGTTAINAALTTTAYHTFKCILFCRMDSTGHLPPGTLALVESDVTAKIGGLGAVILNQMLNLAGEGGINNLSSIGTSTGDCSDCDPCSPCPDISSFVETNTAGVTGTIVGRTDSYIDVQADFYAGLGGGYYVDISSHADATCCVFAGTTVLSGAADGLAPGGDLHNDCGNTWFLSSPGRPTIGDSLNRVGYGSTVPFTIRIRWSA